MRALVLSGGASSGAYEAGVAYALMAEEPFDIVCGASVGALNAVAVAQGRRDALRAIWGSIAQQNITRLRPELDVFRRLVERVRHFRLARHVGKAKATLGIVSELRHLRDVHDIIHVMSLFPWDPLVELLRLNARLGDIRSALFLGVTNLTKSCAAAFYAFPASRQVEASSFARAEPSAIPLTDANYIPAISASAALPPAFEPVWIEDASGTLCAFADGGIANNTPIRQAIDAGASDVTVIFMQHAALRGKNRPIATMADVFVAASDVALDRILELDLKLLRSVNESVLLGKAPGKRFINARVIGPSVPLQIEGLRFDDQASIDRVFDLGVHDGQAALRASMHER